MQEALQDRFECRDEGLYWKWNRTNQRLEGKRAGRVRADGYRYVKVDGRELQEHRAVIFYNGGSIADNEVVHHIDGNKLNNSVSNLVVWEESFHKGWHKAQLRNPTCVKFRVGGVYSDSYITMLSQPSTVQRGYHRGRPKKVLSELEIAERKERAKQYRKEYYAANREKLLASAKEYYKENRQERLAYQKRYDSEES